MISPILLLRFKLRFGIKFAKSIQNPSRPVKYSLAVGLPGEKCPNLHGKITYPLG